MARTRYDACVAQIKADLGTDYGESLDPTRLDYWLSRGVGWFNNLHPDGWPWVMAHVSIENKNEDLEIIKATGAAGADWPSGEALPRLNGISVVKTRHSSAQKWRPAKYRPWHAISNDPRYNRTAGTTEHQEFFSLKSDYSGTAGERPVVTLETFKYSFAAATLDYEIDYLIRSPAVAAGTNADDAFLWEDSDWDDLPVYMAELFGAHELRLQEVFERSASLAKMRAAQVMQGVGVHVTRLVLPPERIIRQPAIVDSGE